MDRAGSAGVWRREGEGWIVGLGERSTFMRASKGHAHIAELLARPGQEVPSLDLVAAVEGVPALPESDAGPALDEQAKREYRTRLNELREEIEEAERFNDPERIAQAREELAFLTRELSAAVGLGGRDRRAGGAAERARVNVTRAIRATLERVGEHDPPLAAHLSAALRTGTACVYRGDVPWDLGTVAGPATMAVVVSDIEDSSALLERLGDERWLELLAVHNGIVREQLARHGGREIKSSGDGFLLTFPEARAAVWFAVDVQRELVRHNERDAERPLRVRMGVHAGEAVEAAGDVFGRTVVIAARVSALARGGEILVSEAVSEHTEGELGDLALGPEREVALKGLKGSHRIRELLWRGEAPAARVARSAAWISGIVEREVELAVVEAALGRAADGQGSVVLFEGPAGIGKSTLLAALIDQAGARGFRVVRARGSELERSFPFGVARQLFDAVLHSMAEEEREQLLRGAVTPAAAMLGATPHGDEPGGRGPLATFEVLNGLFWLLAGLCSHQPVVVAVDDAQWADDQSLQWLEFLVPRAADLQVVVAVAERPTTWEGDALDRLREASGVLVIAPGFLSEDAVSRVVRGTWPEADAAFCRACHVASAGNPFYLREIVAAAQAARVDPTEHGAERLRDVTPDSVMRLVLSRLRRLSPQSRALARACAVLGNRAELGLAARLAELDPTSAFTAADELGRAEILRPGHPLEFAHPLVQAAVEREVPPGARAGLHEEAARALEELGASSQDIAAHLLHAAPGGRPEAVGRLLEAARRSTAEGAPAHAATLLRRALEEPPTPEALPEVLLELGHALDSTGRYEAARPHLERALAEAATPTLRAEILLELARPYRGADAATMVAELDRGARELADEDAALRWALEARALELVGAAVFATPNPELEREHHERLEWVRQTATGTTPGERQLRAIFAVERAIRGQMPAEEAKALALRALDDGSLMRRMADGAWSCDSAIEVLDLVDAFDIADRHAREAEQHARRRGAVAGESYACMLRAMLALHRGALPDAEGLLRSTFAVAREISMPYVVYQAQQIRCAVAIERGDLGAAERACDALATVEVSPMGPPHARGRLLAARGEHALAVAELRAVREMQASTGIWRSMVLGSARADLALSLAAAGELAEAQELAAEEVAVARAFGAPSMIARALRVLARASGTDAALLEEAAQLLAGSQALLLRAKVLCDLGTAQLAAGDPAAARVNLRAGLELAGRCGAHRLAADARRELEAAGERPRRFVPTGADRLTPAERRIAELAVEGASETEIAQSLFLTVRAVEDQLSSVSQKLDVRDRADLADALAV